MALEICTGVATTVIPCLACKAWEEIRYLHKYKSYAQHFENEQRKLSATWESVKLKIDEAKKRNETLVDPRVEDWLERANELLQYDTKASKCFGLCMNCCSQVARAKELESLTKEQIPKLIAEVHEFDAVARAAGVPGMEFHSQEFMSFESRKAKFEELRKELEDESNCMIGLHGLGGTGKSTMAIEVGKHVEDSNPFDKVIFITVSNLVDENRIRHEIAHGLELELEEVKLVSHARQIWINIAHAGKVLIILDDVWEELDLNSIGIQHGIHSKGRCCVLLTTRSFDVCMNMRCQKTLRLDILPVEDALKLFLSHTNVSGNDCRDDLKKVAQEVVNECGGLPVMIVAVAIAFNRWPRQEWQEALIALKNPISSRHGIADEHKRKIYNSLRFSYDNLKDKEAQVLFVLCSVFPKAYEMPIELLSRITIGLGLFGEGARYHIARSHAHEIQNKLLNSSLLLKAHEEYVKMHDVIREMALETIDNEKIQVIMDSKTKLKGGVKYSSCIINEFSSCFEGSELEVFLVWMNANGALDDPNTVFSGMKSLRVLLLHSQIGFGRTSAVSLPKSIEHLKYIQTLILTNWELDDISILMRNLQQLESLELTNCSICELPNEIGELDKLRFLCLIHCSIEKNNTFEAIARCSQLEELYYVSNDDHLMSIDAKVPQIASLPTYHIYHIDGSEFSAFDSSQLDTSIKRCFKPGKLQRTFSKEIIKSLAARADILELEGGNETLWNNVIPGIVSIEDGAMKQLIRLSLKHWSEIKCLINTEHLQLESGVPIFSKLKELQLVEVDVREICCGPYPDGFLKQLEKLELMSCKILESTLFKGELDLGNLKSIEINDCSMTCLFHPFTAQSLRQLERLKIVRCVGLKYIIRDDGPHAIEKVDDKDHNPRIQGSIFPKLKHLSITWCPELEFVVPICFCEDFPLLESVKISDCPTLKYMFGQYPEDQGGLHQMQKEITLPSLKVMSIDRIPLFVNIHPQCYLPPKSVVNTSERSKENEKISSQNVSWGPFCCFWPKSKTAYKSETITFKAAQPDHIASQEKYVGNMAHGIFTPPLYPCNLREMNILNISFLKSLFSVSIASSMLVLEKLRIDYCENLEHVVKEEVDGDDHMNAISIFPNLSSIEINYCFELKYVFPASCSTSFVHLERVLIREATLLKYVFGRSYGDNSSPHRNHKTEIHVPALNKLSLEELPNMVSMCPENYYVKASSLKGITLDDCPQLPVNSFIDLTVQGHERQGQVSRQKLLGMQLCNLKHLDLQYLDMETIYDLKRLGTEGPVNSSLETLSMRRLDELRNLCVGPKYLHLNFQYLFKLSIHKCNKLKFILSTSMSRSMPNLRLLDVQRCGGLERIIEDEEDDDEAYCFPNLRSILVKDCNRLECLFSTSTTCHSLPQLSVLIIIEATELKQVFGAAQELDIKHVFPNLLVIYLEDLPELHTICYAIDFQTVIYREVDNCPNISLTSINFEFLEAYTEWYRASKSTKSSMDDDDITEQLLDRARELSEKAIKRDRSIVKKINGSSHIKEIAETSVEESPKPEEENKADEVNNSEETNNPAPFAAPPQEMVMPTPQEGSLLDEVLRTNQIMNSESSKPLATAIVVPSENEYPHHDNLVRIEGEGKRITLDELALQKSEPDMHSDYPQKNMEANVGETSDEIAMTTETSSPLPRTTTSSTEAKSESSQSDLLDIYSTKSLQVTQAEICMPCVSKQLEDDDLMRLFQGVHFP